jgi:hypothetical protein
MAAIERADCIRKTARVARKPNSVPGSGCPSAGRRSFICGCRLPDTSCDLPGSSGGLPSNAPLFGLAPGGVCRASPVTRGTGALLPHRFTLTRHQWVPGGLLSVALSFASPRLQVMEHPALWCSDFPPDQKIQRSSGLL